MVGPLPINLILSLVFGVGQIVVGAWLAWHSLQSERRPHWRAALLIAVGLWFIVSGVIELFVSGMETSQRLTGAPGAGQFALWRSRADTTLFAFSAALAFGLVVYALAVPLTKRLRAVSGGRDASVTRGVNEGAAREGEQSR